jgi:xylulokinase
MNKSKTEHYILGIDVGTSSVKAGVLNLRTGGIEHFSAEQYFNYSEYSSKMLWERTAKAIRGSTKQVEAPGNILAIGITGQMHGAVFYDSHGQIINPLINWRDQKRCDPSIIEKANRILGKEAAGSIGTNMSCGFTGAILLWLKQNNPGLFQEIRHFVLLPDFVRGKLLGWNDYATDPTNAFGTGLFNTRLNQWHGEVIEALGLPMDIFPQIRCTSEIAGTISAEAAKLLGLRIGIPIIYGGGDNQASMFGSGLVTPASPALINIGTAAQVSKVRNRYRKFSGIDTRPYFENRFAMVGASLGGGGHYERLKNETEKKEGKPIKYSYLDSLASQVPAGAQGLFYCTGPSRADPDRGPGFFGRTSELQHPGCKARAVMEGVLMDLYDSYLVLEQEDSQRVIGAGKALQLSKA